MEHLRSSRPQGMVVELVETTMTEDGERQRSAEHPTGSKSQMRPGEKNAYNGEDAVVEFCEMSYNFEIQQDLYEYLLWQEHFFYTKVIYFPDYGQII